MKLKSSLEVVKHTFKSFSEHKVLRLSAAMAYYAIFSIGPLLVLVVGLAGLVFGEETVKKEVAGQLQSMVGDKSAKIVESMMSSQKSGTSLIATIVGGVGLLLGAAGVFGQLQDALNTIWEVQAKPGGGILSFVRQRFLSMTMVLGIGFLLLISMALSAFINIFAGQISNMVSLPEWVVPAFNAFASFLVVTVLFALIFKVLPDVKVKWSDVWIGAIGTSLLFTLGKFALGLYLGRAGTTSAYGAGAGFVLILMYIYYSSVILFLGAEFTQSYARRKGATVEPTKNAMPVGHVERSKQGIPKEGGKAKDRKPTYQPQPAYASTKSPTSKGPVTMTAKTKTEQEPQPLTFPRRPPIEQIKAEPWSFVGLALTMGIAAGLMFRVKTLRKAVKAYTFVRKFT
jgi:membrane protein